jgi:DHA1 family tetracycline resistance protein-like MFS transporter
LFGLGLDYLVIVFAPSLEVLFIARMISGMCGSSVTVANAYIADISEAENRAKNFGMIGAAFGLGFVIGPTIGGLLGEYGTRVPFMVAACLSLLNWLYGYFVVPESLPDNDRRIFSWKRANPVGTLKSIMKHSSIIGLVVVMFFIYLAANATHANWSFYTEEKFDWTPLDIGLSLGFVGIMVSIVQGTIVGRVVKRIGEAKSVYSGLLFNAIGLSLLGLITQPWMAYAVIILYAFGGLAGPSLQSIMTSQIPRNSQGELQGGLTNVMMLTSIIGPPLMTGIFRYFTSASSFYFPGAPFMLGTLLAIISIFIANVSLKKLS